MSFDPGCPQSYGSNAETELTTDFLEAQRAAEPEHRRIVAIYQQPDSQYPELAAQRKRTDHELPTVSPTARLLRNDRLVYVRNAVIWCRASTEVSVLMGIDVHPLKSDWIPVGVLYNNTKITGSNALCMVPSRKQQSERRQLHLSRNSNAWVRCEPMCSRLENCEVIGSYQAIPRVRSRVGRLP